MGRNSALLNLYIRTKSIKGVLAFIPPSRNLLQEEVLAYAFRLHYDNGYDFWNSLSVL